MGDHTGKPDPTPVPIPFTFALAGERDTQVIPEAQSYGGSYTRADAQANTEMPDAPSAHRSEETSATSTVQHDSTHSLQENSAALEPQIPSYEAATNKTQDTPDPNTSSYVPAHPTSKPSSSSITAAPQQIAPSSSDLPTQEVQDDQEGIVPIGRALEVDVGL